MALDPDIFAQAKLQVLAAKDSAYNERLHDKLYDIAPEQVEEFHSAVFYVDGAVSASSLSFGSVTSPTFIFASFRSVYDGTSGTTDDAVAPTYVQIGDGTVFKTDKVLLNVSDTTNNKISTTIKLSTVAASDTEVTVVAIGKKS